MPFAFPLRRMERFASVIPISPHNSFEVILRFFRISSKCTLIAIFHPAYMNRLLSSRSLLFSIRSRENNRIMTVKAMLMTGISTVTETFDSHRIRAICMRLDAAVSAVVIPNAKQQIRLTRPADSTMPSCSSLRTMASRCRQQPGPCPLAQSLHL